MPSVSTSTAALFSDESQHRALVACVVASILLHLLVLFASPELRPSARTNGPKILTARFTPRLAAPEPAAAIEEAPPKAPEVQPEPPKPKQEAKREAPPAALARPAPNAPATPQRAASALAPNAPAQSASAPATPPVSAPRAPEAQGPPAQQNNIVPPTDAGALNEYRLALVGAAKRYKRYPAQAMEKGWQGRVEIRLVIGANGLIRNASVKISSGYQILDDQAMDMVKKGKPLAQIPAALRGREFVVDIPVIYELQTG